jgi:hypothetical protein
VKQRKDRNDEDESIEVHIEAPKTRFYQKLTCGDVGGCAAQGERYLGEALDIHALSTSD